MARWTRQWSKSRSGQEWERVTVSCMHPPKGGMCIPRPELALCSTAQQTAEQRKQHPRPANHANSMASMAIALISTGNKKSNRQVHGRAIRKAKKTLLPTDKIECPRFLSKRGRLPPNGAPSTIPVSKGKTILTGGPGAWFMVPKRRRNSAPGCLDQGCAYQREGEGDYETHPHRIWETPGTKNCPTPTPTGGGGGLDSHPRPRRPLRRC